MMSRIVRRTVQGLQLTSSATMLVVATLAISSATLIAIFALVDSTLERPLPYLHGDRLVEIWMANRQTGRSHPRLDGRARAAAALAHDVFSTVAAYQFEAATITGPGPAEIVAGARVDPTLLADLGAVPLCGRIFTAADAKNATGVAVVSEIVWRSRLGHRDDLTTLTLYIEGAPYRVVGVLPNSWRFPETTTAVWRLRPMASAAERTQTIGILATNVSPASANQRLGVLSEGWRSAGLLDADETLTTAEPIQRSYNRRFATSLYALIGGAVLLHLVACLNVASLLLARVIRRRSQFAIAAALGASRWDLIRGVVFEGAALAAVSSVVGLGVASWALNGLIAVIPASYTWLTANGPEIDTRVAGFAGGVWLVTSLITSAAPALRVARLEVATALVNASVVGNSGRSGHWWPSAIVAGQLSLALVLLTTGGLLLRSFVRLVRVDPGFPVANLLVVEFQFPDRRTAQARRAFLDELQARVQALPQVRAASRADGAPPHQAALALDVHPQADGGRPVSSLAGMELSVLDVGPEYFRALGVPILAGHAFGAGDPPNAIVISQALAQRVWGNQAAVGQTFRTDPDKSWSVVTGVAGNVVTRGLDASAESAMAIYQPADTCQFCALVVRADSEHATQVLARQVRQQMAGMAPDLPIISQETMDARLHDATAKQRFLVGIASGLACIGLLVSGLGVFSAMSYWVTGQQRELAVRLALGASPGRILRLVVDRSSRVAALGVVSGIGLTAACSRLLVSLLFDTEPTDPLTYAAAAMTVLVVALAASFAPGRTASRLDPALLLRR